MSIWVLRGLRDGVVTTRWPGQPDAYADTWRGPALAATSRPGADPLPLCPTGAISAEPLRVDQGKCILCGRCVAERPGEFAWSQGATGPAAAALTREALVVPEETDEAVEAAMDVAHGINALALGQGCGGGGEFVHGRIS